MTIDPSIVGTKKQPVVPKNDVATIGDLKLPSAAGVPTYYQYWAFVNSLNAGIFPNWSTDPDKVEQSTLLANAMETEWIQDPQSGHNVAL